MADSTQIDVEPEVLRSEIDQSREALTQKIEMLEEKVTETVEAATANVAEATASVLETVQSATASVTGTVDTVTNAVQGTVESVRQSVEGTVDSVREAFDLERQMNVHPWWMLGGAVALGYAGGMILSSGDTRVPRVKRTSMPPAPTPASANHEALGAHRDGRSTLVATDSTEKHGVSDIAKSWIGQLSERFAPEISHLESIALGVMFGCVRDMVAETVPDAIRKQVTDVIDDITQKVGGQHIDGRIIPDAPGASHQY